MGNFKTDAYFRYGIMSIEEAFAKMGTTIMYQGMRLPIKSKRYRCFVKKGTKCVKCGIEGHYFAVERAKNCNKAKCHLNLYHKNKNGGEILMTIDHIIPVSKNGSDRLSNLQTMCTICNKKKDNIMPPKGQGTIKKRQKPQELQLKFPFNNEVKSKKKKT